MKILAILLITIACTQAFDNQTITDVEEFASGFQEGSLINERAPKAKACLDAARSEYPAIQEAIADLQNDNFAKKLEALTTFTRIFQEFAECKEIIGEEEQWVEDVVSAFSSKAAMQEGVQRLESNTTRVSSDIGNLVKSLLSKVYFQTGFNLGDLLATYAFNATSNTTSNATTPSFLQNLKEVPATFDDCGLADQQIQVSGVTYAATPTKGVKDAIVVKGKMLSDQEMDGVDINVLLSGAQLHQETIANTEIFSQDDDYTFQYEVLIPGFAPSGDYQVSFTMKNTDGNKIACVNAKFTM